MGHHPSNTMKPCNVRAIISSMGAQMLELFVLAWLAVMLFFLLRDFIPMETVDSKKTAAFPQDELATDSTSWTTESTSGELCGRSSVEPPSLKESEDGSKKRDRPLLKLTRPYSALIAEPQPALLKPATQTYHP